MSKEEIETMTNDKTIKDNSTEADNELMKEWDQYMSDFVPEDITTVILAGGRD